MAAKKKNDTSKIFYPGGRLVRITTYKKGKQMHNQNFRNKKANMIKRFGGQRMY